MSNTITTRIYTIREDNGQWLGQIILTSDGMFCSVTDYGNFTYVWRHTGSDDFRKFFIGMNADYFGGKIYQGIAYMAYGKKYEKVCDHFAAKILPPLQEVLKKDIEENPIF